VKKPLCVASNKFSDQDSRGLRMVNAKTIDILDLDADYLVALGRFISKCGEELKTHGNQSYHLHFRDTDFFSSKKRKLVLDVTINRTL